ncbi:ABC transporter ATP-binding protein [Komagataeibacter sp. FNDCF1]|uniref:ABC transporter ATP-binding protein n=1 Tax=Komagataeibacter sp. FNDCF1 TaxID=2878681 RepID=UPI001E2FFC1C|nr:ABC transporter ATP-binding protein [Komagataeibacter sp. FNDCF1]MCE2563148.1 ABC transporter ATP-binding protein [Komagataeibacter sp. FNDCF1]
MRGMERSGSKMSPGLHDAGHSSTRPSGSAMDRCAYKLQTRGLYKTYGRTLALDRIDMHVAAGEFVTLLGPSGSGKSTLLQLICGLTPPAGGRLFIDGRDQTWAPPAERDIGVVFQNYALFPHLSVGENVAFPLRIRRVDRAAMVRRAEAALEMVGLHGYAARMPAQLSGGQQQRVALARCLVYRPSLILMDESFSALDRNLRLVMQDEVRRIHRETGTTFIFVTHDQEEAMTMSDRICLMNEGRVVQFDTPRALYATPRTVFAARFIGASTIMHGVVRADGTLQTPMGPIPLPRHCTAPAGTEGAMVLRPENLILHTGDTSGLRGNVEDVTFSGPDQRVVFRLENDERVVLRAPADMPLHAGQQAGVRWEPGAGHFIACP